MVERLPGTIWRLLQTSSPWRQSVIVGVMGAVLLFGGSPDHRGCSDDPTRCEKPPQTPLPMPTRTGTPPLAQELGSYRMTYQHIQSDYTAGSFGKGARCERISATFDKVPASLQDSADTRVKMELDEGRACQALLAKSDDHFASFATAVDQANAITDRAAIDAVTSAMQAFDEFDQTRSGFAATRSKAEKLVAMPQRAAKEFANLQRALDQAGGNGGGAAQQSLMQALGTITPADEKIATQTQKDLLGKARQAVAQFAASQLSAAVATLNADHSLTNYRKVVALYRTVQASKPDAAPVDPGVLETAKMAESELLASDERLRTLSEAAEAWEKSHEPSTCSVLAKASDALRTLDRSRLTQGEQTEVEAAANRAESQIKKDDLILRGSKYWADVHERKHVPILFRSQTVGLSDRIGNIIGGFGYKITRNNDAAALVIDVILNGPLASDTATAAPIPKYVSTISIVDASWVCGGQLTLPPIAADGTNIGNAEKSIGSAVDNFTATFDKNLAQGREN